MAGTGTGALPPCWQSSRARPPGSPAGRARSEPSSLSLSGSDGLGLPPGHFWVLLGLRSPWHHRALQDGGWQRRCRPSMEAPQGERAQRGAPRSLLRAVPGAGTCFTPPHLEGVEEEGEEHLDVAQDARGLLVGGEDKNDLVDAEEGDEGQGGFGQPGGESGDSKAPS